MNIRFASAFETLPARVPHAWHRLSPRAKWIAAGIAAGAVILLLVLWHILAGGGHEAHPPPPVVVAKAVRQDMTVVEHTLGTVVANDTVQVTSRVSGQLLSADFREGQIVHRGDLLFQIDPRSFQAALDQARAQLAKDEAQMKSAVNNQKRYDALYAQGAVSSQQRDETDATAKGAVATVASDRAAIEAAALNLSYTKIYSPIDGKTGPILIQPGNNVNANSANNNNNNSNGSNSGGSNNGNNNALIVVTQFQPVKVSVALPQSDLPQIQDRERANALAIAVDVGGEKLSAPVDFVGNQVSDSSGTIELRATFPNSDGVLVPGQTVDAHVSLNTLRGATVVPRDAVNVGPDGNYVFVVTKDDVAVMRPVTVLFDDGSAMAIKGKVKPGDTVIVDGQLGVLPDNKVSITHRGGKKAEAADTQ